MERKFNQIKEEYNDLQRQMLLKGQMPFKDTGIGFWGGSVLDEVFNAFKKIKLENFRNFIDLGSGDGRVVLAASLFGVKAVGVEVDKELFNRSVDMQRKLELPKALFYNDDFFEHAVSAYDIIFCNPDKPLSRGLEKKLINEMNGKLILHGHHFHPKSLKKEDTFYLNETLFTIYGKE